MTWRRQGPRTRCAWDPVDDRHHWTGPPQWYRNHIWEAPERLASRVDCRNAAKEYRAAGEVETVPTVRQHRHGATWLWA